MSRKALMIRILFFVLLPFCAAWAESGPDNGTDAVKVLFAEAQNELKKSFGSLTADQVSNLEIDSHFKDWLLPNGSSDRLSRLQFYLLAIRLDFQTAPCEDSQGRKASICYFNENPEDPHVLISLQENKGTTAERAMAMLIHEAGHFVGEKDHLFLDQMGVQIVAALLDPQSLTVELASTELVGNIFSGKDECEAGTSKQAETLKKKAKVHLLEMCHARNRDCDLEKTLYSFEGQIVHKPGVGFTMEIKCELKAVLPL